MDYVERLTALRVERRIWQKEVAALLGCNQSTVSRYETRRAKYTVEDMIRLCRFYKVSADYILGLPAGLAHPER